MRKYWLVVFLPVMFQVQADQGSRWYSEQQVKIGKGLFAKNCASCHGGDAASVKDWRKTDKTGKYPPPPLNGTGHTWHHSKKLLEKTIKEGGTKFGGKMPPFENKLTREEISSVIAWFQSLWPDKIYGAWLERGGLPKSRKDSSQKAKDGDKKAPADAQKDVGIMLDEPKPTPVKDILQSKFGSNYIYVTKDGRYGFFGDLIDLKSGDNLTEKLRQQDRLTQLKKFKLEDMTIFPAKGKEKTHITVFTDTSCPFCKKLHAETPVLLKAGVSVHYIPFSRGGDRGPGYADMKSVWCARDRAAAMDIAKGMKKGELGSGDCKAAEAVDRGYQFGIQFGIKGTPAIMLPDGQFISGYRPANKILRMLEIK